MDGIGRSLASRAFFTAVRPKLLSIFGNMETTSQETNKVPSGKGPLLLITSILLSRSVVSLMNDGNLRANVNNQLQLDPTPKHISVVERWCSKWLQKGEISPEVANWVNNQKAKPGVAFGNVKTHKEGNPLRLITSCCGTPIENLSAFTEFYLQPLARKLPSFIKDTTDLLNRIEVINNSGPFPEGTLLVSWDVVSMFPNIDNNLGLTAVKNALDARERPMPSTQCILEAVEICLKHNHSVFQHSFFLQIHGTAMGPKNACSYADLAMGEIDHKAKFCGPIKPALWWRYRDDIFDLWQQGPPALKTFTEYINSLHPTIKFELVFSDNHLNVLDN